MYIAGSTGRGKSVFTEHLIRQDIMNSRKTECGMLLLDPHGSLYHRVLAWMAKNRHHLNNLPVVTIDLQKDDWVIAYNLLRKRDVASPDIPAMDLVKALGYVLKMGGTETMITFRRYGGLSSTYLPDQNQYFPRSAIISTASQSNVFLLISTPLNF